MVLGFRGDAQKFADEKMKACLTSRGYQRVLARYPAEPHARLARLLQHWQERNAAVVKRGVAS